MELYPSSIVVPIRTTDTADSLGERSKFIRLSKKNDLNLMENYKDIELFIEIRIPSVTTFVVLYHNYYLYNCITK